MTGNLPALIRALPKAELHVHLEGAMSPEFVIERARLHGHPFMNKGMEFILSLYNHSNFRDFLAHFRALIEVLQQPDDLYRLILHYAHQARENNIVYAEVLLTPLPLISPRMPYAMMMEAVERGIGEARGLGVELHIILDTVRHLGPEHVEQTLLLHRTRPFKCVIGFGMGGDENAFPAEAFDETFSQARQARLHTAVHSGESGGPESIRKCLERLCPERILHGIRAVEDDVLLSLLVDRKIPLDVCPTSNVRTGVVASMANHPVRALFDRGVRITVNTDDPALFGTTLNREYELLAREFHFTADELLQVAGEGFRASFMPEERKNRYLEALNRVWSLYERGWVV